MFVPEYSITPKVLKNISIIEYAKAVIENTPILPSWENQLKKEAKVILVQGYLINMGLNLDGLKVKGYLDNLDNNTPLEFMDLIKTLDLVGSLSQKKDFTEIEIREIAKTLTHKGGYRDTKISKKPNPEELLALIVQFFDWLQSLDGKETHPIIAAAITKGFFEKIVPFKSSNKIISSLISLLFLNSAGYDLKNIVFLENYFEKTRREYESALLNVSLESADFTSWIEYFTEGMSIELSNVKEKIKLLARDTKIAKATGRVKFTSRQERIVEYLQDYGVLQNKDFEKVFPDISEDSILRDLKVLIGKGIIQKSGSTKSSMYELA